ncbi:MAG: putative DNA binding domain-containing protein [Cytophagales bacterium]|nr:putative DNA binding domain-containing protein [Cytophagales bacterium]
MNFNDDDLLKLIDAPESNWLERKEAYVSGNNKDKVCKTVCAFANALAQGDKGGVLFLGVADNGEIVGIDDTDAVRNGIDEIKSDGRIQPLPSMMTRSLRFPNGKHVMVIIVDPSSLPPVRFKGQIYVRLSASTREGNAEDERVLNERRRHNAGRSFDSEGLPTATLQDLNLRYFEEVYLPTVIAREVLQANGRSLEEKLITTRMGVNGGNSGACVPSVAGVLALGHAPQDWFAGAYVQFVRYAGIHHGGVIVDQATISGNLETVIRLSEEKIKTNIQTPISIVDQDREMQYPDYPLAAVQQIFRNAVLHRSYEGTNAPIRVYWFDDRIEIANPGGPFGAVTEENFGQPHAADYRNPIIAEVMHGLSFAQKFGFGIQSAKAQLQANRNPDLEFSVSPSMVIATIKKN